jgi:hypothetical protein
MSRYEFESDDGRYEVAVGYDPPLQTFFGIVTFENPNSDDEFEYEDDEIILWVGTNVMEITDVHKLQEALKDYFTFSDKVVANLSVDQVHAVPPTEHQKAMLKLFNESFD